MYINEGSLKIHYNGNGDSIKNHQMKAEYVSKSIAAINVIFSETYKEINKIHKKQIETNVYVEGGFCEGSLWWLVKLFSKESESQNELTDNFSFEKVKSAIKQIIDILISLPSNQTEITIKENDAGFNIEIDGETITLDAVQCAILTNSKIRAAISDLAYPLSDPEINTLSIEDKKSPDTDIHLDKKSTTNLIINRNYKHIIQEGREEGFFYVETLSYNPAAKWKLISKNNPGFSINAMIADSKFLLSASENKEKFAKDDLLEIVCTWYQEKSKLTGQIKTHYTIIEIKNHIPIEDRQWRLL